MNLEFLGQGYNRVNQKCFSFTFKKASAPNGWASGPAIRVGVGLQAQHQQPEEQIYLRQEFRRDQGDSVMACK